MELRATALGQRLAQHPYNKVCLLTAGIEVSGNKHLCSIPYNQLISIECKRGLLWGELIFGLPDQQVVRLHGTEWGETQQFFQYLLQHWQAWSAEMSIIAADVLHRQVEKIKQQTGWMSSQKLALQLDDIQASFQSLPLPVQRLPEFEQCTEAFALCQQWLQHGEKMREQVNKLWIKQQNKEHQHFFALIAAQPLDENQLQPLVCEEESVLVTAEAGTGKTALLSMRLAWLLHREIAQPEEVAVLACDVNAAKMLDLQLQQRMSLNDKFTYTFPSLALSIIEQSGKITPKLSELEANDNRRRSWLIAQWQQLCESRQAYAKGWRNWLADEYEWILADGPFWQDPKLINFLSIRLDRWLSLIRSHGGTQTEMLNQAADDCTLFFQKSLRLLVPLIKAWKEELKAEGAVDIANILKQAIALIEKGKVKVPWRHVLLDEAQDISPQQAKLLLALRKQKPDLTLFAVGNDWQSLCQFSGETFSFLTDFPIFFGQVAHFELKRNYRLSQKIGEISGRFVQQNPYQTKRSSLYLEESDPHSIVALPQQHLEKLLDKLSSFVLPTQRILILLRYPHLAPDCLSQVATRWPKLQLECMAIHDCKGQQADFVIILELSNGINGFPAAARESIFDEVLLPIPEEYPDAAERRLLYVALTRAKQQVWLLYDPDSPSIFIQQLKELGAILRRKP